MVSGADGLRVDAPHSQGMQVGSGNVMVNQFEAAQRLLPLVDRDGARAGKYAVDARGAQGVQIGDNNRQFNQFSTPPRAP